MLSSTIIEFSDNGCCGIKTAEKNFIISIILYCVVLFSLYFNVCYLVIFFTASYVLHIFNWFLLL